MSEEDHFSAGKYYYKYYEVQRKFRREMLSLIPRVKLYLNLKVCTDILIIHIDYYRFTFQSF